MNDQIHFARTIFCVTFRGSGRASSSSLGVVLAFMALRETLCGSQSPRSKALGHGRASCVSLRDAVAVTAALDISHGIGRASLKF